MKDMGGWLIGIGILGLVIGLAMDPTVESSYGSRVYNEGKLDNRRHAVSIAETVIISGTVLFAAGKLRESKEDA